MKWWIAIAILLCFSQVGVAEVSRASLSRNPPQEEAQIGLLFEPFAGYQTGGFKYAWGDTMFNGYLYGARLGADFAGLQLGLEYIGGQASDDQAPARNIYVSDFGLFLGYRFEQAAHVYATYYISQNERASNAAYNDTYSGAYAMKVGVGAKVFDPIWVNMEYGFGTFSEDNGGTLASELKTHYVGLLISVPLVLTGKSITH